jgi:probable phosphoglycerate mutase
MTTFLLIRHGKTDDVSNALAGRIDSPLNDQGRQQASLLADTLAHLPIQKILSSPLLRAQQTAQPLAKQLNLPVTIEKSFLQVSFGDWEGVPFEELDLIPAWKTFQQRPSEVTPPNGEAAANVRKRVHQALLSYAQKEPPESVIAIFSHGSIIRHSVSAAIGLPLNQFNFLRIAPASITTIRIIDNVGKLIHLNQQVPTRWI